MVAAIDLGRELAQLVLRLVAGSNQSFGLTWSTVEGDPADLGGNTLEIRFDGGGPIWEATITGDTSMWNLDRTDVAALDGTSPTGHVVLGDGTDEVVVFKVYAEVQS